MGDSTHHCSRYGFLVVFMAAGALSWFSSGCTTGNGVPDPAPSAVKCGRAMLPNEEGGRCEPLRVSGVDSKNIMFPSKTTPGGKVALTGTITTPRWGVDVTPPAKSPAVLLVHASGPLSRNAPNPRDIVGNFSRPVSVFKDLAEALTARGYIVLRYDKRTCTSKADPLCTYPSEVAQKATWADLKGDVEAAASFLAKQPGVDPQDIILMGHSQGANLALDASKTVRPSALVMLAGTWSPIDQVIVRQIRWQLESQKSSLSPADLKKANNKVSEIESGLQAIREDFLPPEEIFLSASAAFWKSWFDATDQTAQQLAAYQGPVLYLRGGDDHNVDPQDHAGFNNALRGKPGSSVQEIPEHTHAFSRRGGKPQVSPQTTRAILQWLSAP